MQPCRGRRHGSALAGVHGLVAIAIGAHVVALDVWRQRNVSDALDGVHEIDAGFGPQPHNAPAVKVLRHDLAMDSDTRTREEHACSRFQLLTRMDERLPFSGTPNSQISNSQLAACEVGSWDVAKKQTFDSPSTRDALTEQPRGKDSRIVQHEQIASAQVLAESRKLRVLDLAGVPAQDEEPRGAADRRRLLGDELRRKIEVELGHVHVREPIRLAAALHAQPMCTTRLSWEAVPPG
jgi:hypothetical protein